MHAESDGESLRNFDKKFHSKIRTRCEKTLQIRPAPYLRDFTLKEIDSEKSDNKNIHKQKVREPWRKRPREKKSKNDKKSKKSDIGTFQLSDNENGSPDEDDVKWNFGVSLDFQYLLYCKISIYSSFSSNCISRL